MSSIGWGFKSTDFSSGTLIVIGASRFPLASTIDAPEIADALLRSKNILVEQLATGPGRMLDLFDADLSPNSVCLDIYSFLKANSDCKDVVVYYLGHGGFMDDSEYFLALRSTHDDQPHSTGLQVKDLARTLERALRNRFQERVYLILDCCFAGNALPHFLAPVGDVIAAQATQLPSGISLLNASSRYKAALVPPGGTTTMFSGCLAEVLSRGTNTPAPRLSLRELACRTTDLIRDRFRASAVQPEVHSPRQRDGDPATYPYFPNRHYEVPTDESMAVSRTTSTARVAPTKGIDATPIDRPIEHELENPKAQGSLPPVTAGDQREVEPANVSTAPNVSKGQGASSALANDGTAAPATPRFVVSLSTLEAPSDPAISKTSLLSLTPSSNLEVPNRPQKMRLGGVKEIVVGLVAVFGLVALVLFGIAQLMKPPFQRRAYSTMLTEAVRIETAGSPSRGPDNAPLTLVTFTDFQNAHCGEFEGSLVRLEEAFPGSLRRVYKAFPMSNRWSARAVLAAEMQGRFWQMHDALLGRFDVDETNIEEVAVAAGIDAKKLKDELSSVNEGRIERDIEEAKKLEVYDTPTIFLNGHVLRGVHPYDTLKKMAVEVANGIGSGE